VIDGALDGRRNAAGRVRKAGLARLRPLVRRLIPSGARASIRNARRLAADRFNGTRFARRGRSSSVFGHPWAYYERPFIDYPGQEQFATAKRGNQRILASFLNGTIIRPGEVFSLWRLAPRPTERLGYGRAAAIRGTMLTSDVGGAICLLSTVLYNVALLAGQEIVERHCHCVDHYGARRYFEPGRDAAIEWAHQDLRFRNAQPRALRLGVGMDDSEIWASLEGTVARPFEVEIEVSVPVRLFLPPRYRASATLAPGTQRLVVPAIEGSRLHTWRTLHSRDGVTRRDDLGWTEHQPVGALIEVGAGR
jgi:vancomycin resistance protein VanW